MFTRRADVVIERSLADVFAFRGRRAKPAQLGRKRRQRGVDFPGTDRRREHGVYPRLKRLLETGSADSI